MLLLGTLQLPDCSIDGAVDENWEASGLFNFFLAFFDSKSCYMDVYINIMYMLILFSN